MTLKTNPTWLVVCNCNVFWSTLADCFITLELLILMVIWGRGLFSTADVLLLIYITLHHACSQRENAEHEDIFCDFMLKTSNTKSMWAHASCQKKSFWYSFHAARIRNFTQYIFELFLFIFPISPLVARFYQSLRNASKSSRHLWLGLHVAVDRLGTPTGQ